MTPRDFRTIALSFPEVIESAHQGHPDFRVANKVFASLGAPGREWGMVKLTPSQQARFVADHSKAFVPAAGAWGKRGYTNVRLAPATKTAVREAMGLAWRNVAPPRIAGGMQWP